MAFAAIRNNAPFFEKAYSVLMASARSEMVIIFPDSVGPDTCLSISFRIIFSPQIVDCLDSQKLPLSLFPDRDFRHKSPLGLIRCPPPPAARKPEQLLDAVALH